MNLRIALNLLLAAACAVTSAAAVAQAVDFPNRPTRMIVPFPPGGSLDPFARLLSQKLVELWNGSIVKALRLPDVAERIGREGADIIASSSAQFGAYLKTELVKWAKVVKDNGLKVE